MTKNEAVQWLLNHLEPEIAHGGCPDHRLRNDCITCEDNLAELKIVKETLHELGNES